MSERILEALAAAPLRGQLVRHTDGGIYRFVGLSQSTEDQSLWHLYDHVWPFESSLIPWARPSDQWGSRFVAITEEDLHLAMRQDRTLAQQSVTAAKAARRAASSTQGELALESHSDIPPDFHAIGASQGFFDLGKSHGVHLVTRNGELIDFNPFNTHADADLARTVDKAAADLLAGQNEGQRNE